MPTGPETFTLGAASVAGSRGVVVTTHHLATAAGVGILRSGGNAVDAAVAANAVVGVALPDTCGVGGDLFALVHRPGDRGPAALNASGRAGSGADPARLRREGHATVPIHGAAGVTVPGCVDGWEALITRFGTMSLAEVLAPAVAVATEGFEVSLELAGSLERTADLLIGPEADRTATALSCYPGGRAPQQGTVLRRPELAATLTLVGEQGRDGFYTGPVGEAIGSATDGVITPGDLAVPQADWVEPVGLTVYGLEAWTVPPNSRGYIALTAAWLAERLVSSPGTARRIHHLVEAYRAAADGSADVVADPRSATVAVAGQLAPEHLHALLASIRPDAVAVRPASMPAAGGTTYLCCRDGWGLGVSLIQSNFYGIGSGLTAGDTGVFLHDRGAGFNLIAGHPNELAPGRRPAHTLSPTLWTEAGTLRMLLGTRGGSYQPQLLVQMIDHMVGTGLTAAEAMLQPRWVIDDDAPDHRLLIEDRVPAGIIADLEAFGHRVSPAAPFETGWGPVAAVTVTPTTVTGTADPRVSTASVGVA